MRNVLLWMLLISQISFGQYEKGSFSLGGRSTFSLFNQEGSGNGLGGQFRIGLSEKINTEWFADYLSANHNNRKDYHIGWSVLYYPFLSTKKLQPYTLVGHCFDLTKETEDSHGHEHKNERFSSAIQGGIGVHLWMDQKSDLSFSSQYMVHLGQERKKVIQERHLLLSISYNYKLR